MLDEQASRNLELQAKVNELKAKLIVSSVPRGKSPVVSSVSLADGPMNSHEHKLLYPTPKFPEYHIVSCLIHLLP